MDMCLESSVGHFMLEEYFHLICKKYVIIKVWHASSVSDALKPIAICQDADDGAVTSNRGEFLMPREKTKFMVFKCRAKQTHLAHACPSLPIAKPL